MAEIIQNDIIWLDAISLAVFALGCAKVSEGWYRYNKDDLPLF